jgi:hypothetical protein
MDMALFLKLSESVDWDRILRSPKGESSFRFLVEARTRTHTHTHGQKHTYIYTCTKKHV